MTIANTRPPGLGKRLFLWAAAGPPAEAPGGSPLCKRLRFVLWWLTRVVIICHQELTSNFLTIRASALTFAVLLSLVPALAITTAIYKGLGGEDQLRLAAHRYLDELDRQPVIQLGDKPDKAAETGTDAVKGAAAKKDVAGDDSVAG
ncbi:MAG TPA: hypothetical protein DEB25_08245, partial [Desulfobulbaceae bacterium]|nr:hypothetical protein [Desulfobulbaceae bacterium]